MLSLAVIVLVLFFLWAEENRSDQYREWYLRCRNELEKLDPDNEVLKKIGPRISKKEKWEDAS